jgi:hypothetical protein
MTASGKIRRVVVKEEMNAARGPVGSKPGAPRT